MFLEMCAQQYSLISRQSKPLTCILTNMRIHYIYIYKTYVQIDIAIIVSTSCQKSIRHCNYILDFILWNRFHTIQMKTDECECFQRLVLALWLMHFFQVLLLWSMPFFLSTQSFHARHLLNLLKQLAHLK